MSIIDHSHGPQNPFVHPAPSPVTPTFLATLKAGATVTDEAGQRWRTWHEPHMSKRWYVLTPGDLGDRNTYFSDTDVADALIGDVTITDLHYQALCNECGSLRMVSGAGARRSRTPDCMTPQEIAETLARKLPKHSRIYWQQARPYEYAMCDLKCRFCGTITRHALVRDEWSVDRPERENARTDATRRRRAE